MHKFPRRWSLFHNTYKSPPNISPFCRQCTQRATIPLAVPSERIVKKKKRMRLDTLRGKRKSRPFEESAGEIFWPRSVETGPYNHRLNLRQVSLPTRQPPDGFSRSNHPDISLLRDFGSNLSTVTGRFTSGSNCRCGSLVQTSMNVLAMHPD